MELGTWFYRIRQRIRTSLHRFRTSGNFRENTQVARDNTHLNLRRLILLTTVAVPVHVAVILQFTLNSSNQTPAEGRWRQGIIWAHAGLMAMMILLNVIARLLRKRLGNSLAARLMPHIMIAGILAGGIGITATDQIVTTNITPYLLACLIAGMVFLIRPGFSLLYYLIGYLVFFMMIGSNTSAGDILLSNRVNGLVITAFGFMMASMMWRYNLVNYRQKQRILQQQQQLEGKNKELEKMAFFDSLTTLPNRRFFDEIIQKEIALIQRDNHASSLIMLDIDHFKDINDTFGHPAGDVILKQVSLMLKSTLRKSDLLARLGGEEFIILLPGTNLAGAGRTAEKLREAVENMTFLVDSQVIQITASFGVAPVSSRRDRQVNYYAECDKALYIAKQNGRNRVETTVTA